MSLSKTLYPLLVLVQPNKQEMVTTMSHDNNIVEWDEKNQVEQITDFIITSSFVIAPKFLSFYQGILQSYRKKIN